MLGKISIATAVLATAAYAEQELEVAPEARELADAFLGEEANESRRLADEWIEGHSDDLRQLKGSRSTTSAEAAAEVELEPRDAYLPAGSSSIAVTPVPSFPWPFPFYRTAYCRMRYNPAYPTTYPYGAFWLHEYGPWAPLRIRGYMRQMPGPNSRHGFLINRNRFNGRDCASTEPTWNPWGQPQGSMNSWPSRAGDLNPITDFSGNSFWYGFAWQPTLYGRLSVRGRSMCIYEDYGRTEREYGRQIACCDIRRFWVVRHYDDVADFERAEADEDDVEVITVEEYEKMFGEKFDSEQFAMDAGDMDVKMPDHFDGNQ